MGRKSRLKRERREREKTGMSGIMREISQDSMQALLEAASASPTSNYVLPSIATAFCCLAQQRRHGQLPARPDHLTELLETARRERPDLERLEDFVPGDSREEVLVPWAGDLHRILPGSLSQPASLLEVARQLADVIDPALVGTIEFGLSDAIELVLRRVSHAVHTLAPEWVVGEPRDLDAPPFIAQCDLSVASTLVGIESQVDECRDPYRAGKALQHHTVPTHHIRCDPDWATLGPVIAVKCARDRHIPLPAGLLMDSIPALMNGLSQQAHAIEANLSAQWAAQIAKTLRRRLDGAGHRVIGVQNDRNGNPSLLVVRYSSQQILLLGIAASLDGPGMQHVLNATTTAFAGQGSPAIPHALLGHEGIDPGRRPEALQIIACPTYPLQLVRGRVRVVTLQDILWMLRTAEHPSDLWRYARDIREAEETVEIFTVDEADLWQWWSKNGKSFHVGGIELGGALVAPEIQLDEWDLAASLSAVERALLVLDLPEASAWPILDCHETSWVVADAESGCRYGIAMGDVPIAVGWGRGAWYGDDALMVLADGTLNKLQRISEPLTGWLAEQRLDALRVDLVIKPDHDGPAVEFGSFTDNTLTLHYQKSLQARFLADGAAVEHAVGTALSQGAISRERRSDFLDAWSRTPRSMLMGTPHFRRMTPCEKPVTVGVADDSRIRRELAIHLCESDVECREYTADEAKRLDSTIIYPWLLSRLRDELNRYSSNQILVYALEQLERLNYERDLIDRKTELFLGFQDRSERGDQYLDDSRNEIVVHIRYVSLIIEQLVASPPSGNALPNLLAWEYIICIAGLCVESGFRSEAIHTGMSNATIRVSERFDLEVHHELGFADFDMESYSKCWIESTRPPAIDLDNVPDRADDRTDVVDMPRVADLMPGLEPIDVALREVWGFGLQAIVGALDQACSWKDYDPASVHVANTREFAEAAFAADARANAAEYEKAVEWLTLTSVNPEQLEPWEIEQRADRITSHPFLRHEDGIYVLSWTAGAALKMVFNYLEDGRLPWPKEVLKREREEGFGQVVEALDTYRQSLNRRLEHDAVHALEASGFKVLRNIKPQKRHRFGIEKLSGEVDLLCIDSKKSVIWVVEVKDPYAAFSTRSTMRIVQKFHEEGGYITKLLKKCKDIAASASSLAATQALSEPERHWETRGIVATRVLCPAAFVRNSKAEFCTVEELHAAVCRPD